MTSEGPAVLHITQHFVERWNEAKGICADILLFLDLTCSVLFLSVS